MTRAKRYWAAAPKSVYEANIEVEDGKVYYSFHGEETAYSDSVGDIVRDLVECESEEQYVVFRYVPVPSSMHAACWAALNGDDPSLCAFKVRVHEKFEFPQLSRGAELAEAATPVPYDLDDGESREATESEDTATSHAAPARRRAHDALCEAADRWRRQHVALTDDGGTEQDSDVDDLCEIASLILRGDDEAAARKVMSLDTIVRDAIPEEAYTFCGLRSLR